jgi:hypothetical protein
VTDPPQRIVDLLVLDLELARVGELLPRRARMVGERRDAVRAAFQQLDRPRLRVGALAVTYASAHEIAGEGPVDEHDVAVAARDAGAAKRHRVDP